MSAPSAARLLDAWERGHALAPLQRALLLLAAARPDVAADAHARLPLGERDRLLAGVRAEIFGDCLDASTTCPSCRAPLELTLSVTALWDAQAEPASDRYALSLGDYELTLRPPSTLDLLAAQAAPAAEVRDVLLDVCVQASSRRGSSVPARSLPDSLRTAAAERMAELDPGADLRVALSCAECGHSWESAVDIASYLWSELEDWAARVLREVHVLARAYGWREADILALSASRRQRYLEMAGA